MRSRNNKVSNRKVSISRRVFESVSRMDESTTVSRHQSGLKVGDKVFFHHGGDDFAFGKVHSTDGRSIDVKWDEDGTVSKDVDLNYLYDELAYDTFMDEADKDHEYDD